MSIAHNRLLYHSTLGSRIRQKKERWGEVAAREDDHGRVCVCVCARLCVSVSVCVCERERERERERGGTTSLRERTTTPVCVCVCLCLCERERERDRGGRDHVAAREDDHGRLGRHFR